MLFSMTFKQTVKITTTAFFAVVLFAAGGLLTNRSAQLQAALDCHHRLSSLARNLAGTNGQPALEGRRFLRYIDDKTLTAGEVVFDNACRPVKASRKELNAFQAAFYRSHRNLTVFWSPYSILDEQNFTALKQLKRAVRHEKVNIFLLLDPLADPQVVARILKKAGLPDPRRGRHENTQWGSRLKVYYADKTGFKLEMPLCEFPVTTLWQLESGPSGLNYTAEKEWMADFPEKEIRLSVLAGKDE